MVKFLNSDGLTRLVALIKQALGGKQDALVSGTNIKTVNSNTLLGSGNVYLNDAAIPYDGNGAYALEDASNVQEALDILDDAVSNIEPNEIASITATESSVSGGNNVVTITDTDGNSTSFNVKNGIDGQDGADGADGVSLGEIALVQTTGDSEESVMSQKAVTEYGYRVTEGDMATTDTLVQEPRLPYGYDELDWIYNGVYNSGAVLDTLLLPNDANWRFVGSWKLIGSARGFSNVIGAATDGNMNTYSIRLNGVQLYVSAHQTLNAYTNITLNDAEYYNWHYYDLRQGTITLDGTDFTLGSTTHTPLTVTLKLGHVSFPQRIGEFKAYHNNELVADLVPCKHGNDVGMYDIVRKQFFTSSNTNNFIAGNYVGGGKDRLISGESLALFASKKVTIEDIQGTSDWIKARLEERGWNFGVRLYYQNLTADLTKCVSPMLDIEVSAQEVLTIYHGTNADYGMINRYFVDGSSANVAYESGIDIMPTYTANNSSSKLRFTVGIDKIAQSYIYSQTNNKYLFRGDEFIYNTLALYDISIPFNVFYSFVISQDFGYNNVKLISQKAITEKFDSIVYEGKKPTYFTGKLTKFAIADYPLLDPTNCEGVSVLISSDARNMGGLNNIFCLFPDNTTNTKYEYIGFTCAYGGNFRIGLMENYSGSQIQGIATNKGYGNHTVVTMNFKNGEVRVYQNGVLTYNQTISSYDASVVQDFLESAQYITLNTQNENKGVHKHLGVAVFGHVLLEKEVTEIFGGGRGSITTELVPDVYRANQLCPFTTTDWGVFLSYGTSEAVQGGGYLLTANSSGLILFGFTGIPTDTLINNCIYEWDFTVTSGTGTDIGGAYSRRMQYSQTVNADFVITDSNGNDVTHSDLVQGQTYHVVCTPDNIKAGSLNASSLCLVYYLYGTTDFSITIHPTLKLQERGAALICSNNTFRGSYWEQPNGDKLSIKDFTLHEAYTPLKAYYDTYISASTIYNSGQSPQINGQIAVDTTNNKIYAGYLTGTGGTWKQINNS